MKTLGPYHLQQELAVGGMAEVFLAEHRAPAEVRRDVVVKRVLPQFVDDPEFRDMFLDEARLMAALAHPYIAQVYDVGLDGKNCYLVMEYIRGPTVRDLLGAAAGRGELGLPRPAGLAIGLAVAEALEYVHRRLGSDGRPLGIVHRDLNPSNVMVSYTGGVKLIDFGIAKAASRLHQTRGNIVRGTRGYIAPEQIDRRAPLDHRADVFAMGVLLYELCLGRHPFGDTPDAAQLMRVVQGRFVPPTVHAPDFPPALDRLLRACLEPNPAERPATMRAVVDALAEHMRQTGELATLAELGELAAALVPATDGARAIERPSRQTREHLDAVAGLEPQHLTEPSLVLGGPPDDDDDDEATTPTQLVDLDPADDSTQRLRRDALLGPNPPGRSPSKGPSAAPDGARHTRAMPMDAVGRPPVGPPPMLRRSPEPPRAPPAPPAPPGLVETVSMGALELPARPPKPSGPPRPRRSTPPRAAPVRPTMTRGPATIQGHFGVVPRRRRHNFLLLVLLAVVLGLASALVVLLITR